eukprot:SAG31_NODE_27481_length_425_cov_0.957055_1_plen_49_part_10
MRCDGVGHMVLSHVMTSVAASSILIVRSRELSLATMIVVSKQDKLNIIT